ncbi:MAG: methionine--tRNA ligase [Phycisphaerales bacterium]|nr:methionine--tRNA ligase [Phycisphaerales bacterium]
MPKRFLVTSGLPYSNGRLHVGHIAGAYLPADIFVRYQRACGHDVRFICGSDDNGVSIEIKALSEGRTPQEVSSHYHAGQRLSFEGLRIEFDVFGGTHQPGFVERHERMSQAFFLRIHEQGFFTKRSVKQLYDPRAERFLPDSYVRGTCHHPDCASPRAKGDQCEQCGRLIDPLLLINPVSEITGERAVVRETTHWYLRLADFEQRLTEWLESKRDSWRPHVLNFALGQIRQGLPERAMTRDISWGIPVPLDDPDARGKVLFVWFDAPIGYVSFTAALCAKRDGDENGWKRWWCDPESAVVHFIGEDNTVFHTLIWPAMLMAEGTISLPTTVVANNFVNYRDPESGEIRKISKSTTPEASPVWVEEYVRKGLDPDALRYYLTAIAPESARSAFDPQDFVARNNNELVAALGNFVNRTLAFVDRYFERRVPDPAAAGPAEAELRSRGGAALERVGAHIDGHRYRAALEELMSYARDCNLYFGQREPWRTRKDALPQCAATLHACIHAVRVLAVLCAPFMPGAAQRLLRQLNVTDALHWAVPDPLPAGHALGEPQILFPKLEPGCMGDPA